MSVQKKFVIYRWFGMCGKSSRTSRYDRWMEYCRISCIICAGNPALIGLPLEEFTRKVIEVFRREGIDALERYILDIKKLSQKNPFLNDVKITLKTLEGHPAERILQKVEEENIDLIVMGASGKNAIERFLLGSETGKVVRSAKCPVLTVH